MVEVIHFASHFQHIMITGIISPPPLVDNPQVLASLPYQQFRHHILLHTRSVGEEMSPLAQRHCYLGHGVTSSCLPDLNIKVFFARTQMARERNEECEPLGKQAELPPICHAVVGLVGASCLIK